MTETAKMVLFFVTSGLFYFALMVWAHEHFVG